MRFEWQMGASSMSSKIPDAIAREIIDCRGFPTIEVDIWVDGEFFGRANVHPDRSTEKRSSKVHREIN
jgi:enolase